MKILFLSLLLVSALSRYGHALVSPSNTQMQALQTQLNAIQSLQGKDDGPDPTKWTGIAGLIKKIDIEEFHTLSPNHANIASWKQQLVNHKAQLPPLCQKLMDDTRADYGIKPRRYSGKIVLLGDFKDTYADYRPKFGEMDQTRVKNNRAGRSIAMGQPNSYDAIAWENGDIIITIAAFKLSPGYLAAIINHETIHFDQFTDPKRGAAMTPVERERAAYNMMRGLTNRSIFNLSPAELATIEKRFEDAMRNALFSPNGTMVGASGFYSVDLTQNPNGEELLLQAMREAKEAAAKQRERIELERQRDHDERLRNTLAALALRSCANPGSVTQDELDKLPLPSREDFYYRNLPGGLKGADGSGYCVEPYQYMGLWAGKRPDAEKVRILSIQPINVQPPPPAEAVQPIQETPIARQPPPPPFLDAFPLMKEFALEACRAPEQVTIPGFLTRRYDFSRQTYDEELARKYAASLGGCPSQLFNHLFSMMRAGQVYGIDRQWIRSKVAEAGGGSAGGTPQGGGGPDQKHPIIVIPKPPW